MKFPEQFRWKEGPAPAYRSNEGDDFGFFLVPVHKAPENRALKIMATAGHEEAGENGQWEHVSVSLSYSHKCPSWNAMCFVKSLFWDSQECVIQYHPPEANYVNNHSGCLHLWRSKTKNFPMPPVQCV